MTHKAFKCSPHTEVNSALHFRAALVNGEEASACHNRVHVGGSFFSLGQSLVA